MKESKNYTTNLQLTFNPDEGTIRIDNDSPFRVEVILRPKDRRRKLKSTCIVFPRSFLIIENLYKFNIEDYYFKFLGKKEKK